MKMFIGNRIPWRTRPTSWAVRISAVGTTALKHEPLNDSMEMQTVVVTIIHQFQEVSRRNWHGVGKQFNGDVTLACRHQYLCHISVPPLWVFESVQSPFR